MFGVSFFNKKTNINEQKSQVFDAAEQHRLEREQFETVLHSFQATQVQERLIVLDIFLSIETHLTLSELEKLVQEREPSISDRAFLKETMEMFCQYGFAQKLSFENQEVLYEHHHIGMHHDHFICIRCGAIQEFINHDLETLQIEVAQEFNFHPLQHKMEVYGLCSNCMARRESTLPLRLAANGERVRIVHVGGDRTMQARLADMGLTVGICVEVISNNPSGPIIVAISGSRLAVTSDISQHISVVHSCRHKDK